MSFVDESLIKELLKDPPSALYIVVVKCDIWIIKVNKICHSLCHLSPLICISENRLTALFVKLLDSVLFYILLTVHVELLLNFDFYRKTVCIPTSLTINLVTLHCPVSTNGILKCSCHYMVYSWHSVSRWRSLVKDIFWFPLACCYALL